jgi:hypothetical protein
MDEETFRNVALPVALLISAVCVLWKRGERTDAALLAAHQERIARLEVDVAECQRDRTALRVAFEAHLQDDHRRQQPKTDIRFAGNRE